MLRSAIKAPHFQIALVTKGEHARIGRTSTYGYIVVATVTYPPHVEVLRLLVGFLRLLFLLFFRQLL